MSYSNVIFLIVALAALGQTAPAWQVEEIQSSFPSTQEVYKIPAAEESIDIGNMVRDILSSILGSKCPGDELQRLGALLARLDNDDGEYGGKDLGQFFEGLAKIYKQYAKDNTPEPNNC